MAPKKKEKNLKRSNIITLKLTDIELAVLNEAADVTGLSRSEYLRKLLLEKQLRRRIPRGQWAIRWIIHRLRWLFAQFFGI